MYRHGDVFIEKAAIPAGAKELPHCVLAKGELTGHQHEIREPEAARLLQYRGKLYLRVTAKSATLVHQEHKPIALSKGDYRVWIQREYLPKPRFRGSDDSRDADNFRYVVD